MDSEGISAAAEAARPHTQQTATGQDNVLLEATRVLIAVSPQRLYRKFVTAP